MLSDETYSKAPSYFERVKGQEMHPELGHLKPVQASPPKIVDQK